MIRGSRDRAVAGFAVGILMLLAGFVLPRFFDILSMPGYLMLGSGVIMVLYGCVYLAWAKGYPTWVGVLAFFTCLGLVLVPLPDRRRT